METGGRCLARQTSVCSAGNRLRQKSLLARGLIADNVDRSTPLARSTSPLPTQRHPPAFYSERSLFQSPRLQTAYPVAPQPSGWPPVRISPSGHRRMLVLVDCRCSWCGHHSCLPLRNAPSARGFVTSILATKRAFTSRETEWLEGPLWLTGSGMPREFPRKSALHKNLASCTFTHRGNGFFGRRRSSRTILPITPPPYFVTWNYWSPVPSTP